MPRRITRKQAEKIIKRHFSRMEYVIPICAEIPRSLSANWMDAWEEMNTQDHDLMWRYSPTMCSDEVSFLRLLTLHFWVRHDFK